MPENINNSSSPTTASTGSPPSSCSSPCTDSGQHKKDGFVYAALASICWIAFNLIAHSAAGVVGQCHHRHHGLPLPLHLNKTHPNNTDLQTPPKQSKTITSPPPGLRGRWHAKHDGGGLLLLFPHLPLPHLPIFLCVLRALCHLCVPLLPSPMFTIQVTHEFCAAHSIILLGTQEPIHGHNFKTTAIIIRHLRRKQPR